MTSTRAQAAAKRAEVGEEELRHRVRPGVLAKLDELMRWANIERALAVDLGMKIVMADTITEPARTAA